MSSTPPPGSPISLEYQTPATLTPELGIWREGGLLVTSRDAKLPELCLKCGLPGDGRPIRKIYYWHHPAWYLLVLVPPFCVLYYVVCKKAALTVSLCKAHRRQRRRNGVITAVLLLAVPVLTIASVEVGSRGRAEAVLGWAALASLLAGLLWMFLKMPLLRAVRIDREFARFRGASAEFLDLFPSIQR